MKTRHPTRRQHRSWIVLFALLVALVAACGNSTVSAPPGGSISGTITYSGAAAGGGRPLGIAVYRRYPPSGPPIAYRLVETYQFPYHYVFDGLPPGDYVVGALIDVDPTDTRYVGMLNAKRDPFGYTNAGQLTHLDDQQGASGLDIQLKGSSE